MRYFYFFLCFSLAISLAAQSAAYPPRTSSEFQISLGATLPTQLSSYLGNTALSDLTVSLAFLRSRALGDRFTLGSGISLGSMGIQQEYRQNDARGNLLRIIETRGGMIQLGIPLAIRYYPFPSGQFYLSGGGHFHWNAVRYRSARMYLPGEAREEGNGVVWPAGDFSIPPFIVMAEFSLGLKKVTFSARDIYFELKLGHSLRQVVRYPRLSNPLTPPSMEDASMFQLQLVVGTTF